MPNFDFNAFTPAELLGQDPRIAYFSFQRRFGQAPRQRRFFEDFFPEAQNEFLGLLGEQIRRGEIPTLQFVDFLEGFPFEQRYQGLPPSFRGQSFGRFSPSARYFFR